MGSTNVRWELSWRQLEMGIAKGVGIFMGEDRVVHFTCASASRSCSACELFEYSDRDSGVIASCLDCFLKSGLLRRYKYGVSERRYWLRRRGTCNTAESGPVEVVMERAESLLAKNGFGDYDLLKNNCEDFATFCKTGQGCNLNGTARRYGQASLIPQALASRRA
ncbi:protein LEAD-SENSITIVE 1-like [Salvia miltiorrhiza]|uniref:protein LEAD-SENSITIVE 1-like n=1 Tax=Salvia miltiorrhiza TaxID=226208 RepID=UPI0025AB7F88|nr:protein LEAD-SENSITIVE 1-like [Salvia miltiorrhiza]